MSNWAFLSYGGLSLVSRLIREIPLYVNDAYLDHYDKPARARLRGLVRNPAIPAELLRQLVGEQLEETKYVLTFRKDWTAEQFDAVATHPNPRVRAIVAQTLHITPEQRATFVEDPAPTVLHALAQGPGCFPALTWTPQPALPTWAYERLLERDPNLILFLIDDPGLPPEIRSRLQPAGSRPESDDKPVPDPREVETQTYAENEWTRSVAAADPALPAESVARLALDPSPLVRLAVSMRPELSEEQRAGIDYHVGRDDRIRPARWAVETLDHQAQRRCAFSAHVGLRRSVACNPNLTADLVAVLATDDDFAVRLLLCERHTNVPFETVLATYLEARTMTRGRLLNHPSFQRIGLARLADSPNREARALVILDPEAPPRLIEQLSNDPDPMVRASTAADRRLSPGRVLELFEDPSTAGAAAANPHLPVPVMHRVLADAAELAREVVEGKPAVYLGRWSPDQLPRAEE